MSRIGPWVVWEVWEVQYENQAKEQERAPNRKLSAKPNLSAPLPKLFDASDGDVKPTAALGPGDEFVWDEGDYARRNYLALGRRLAEAGDLFRSPTQRGGLILMLPDGKYATITKGADLMPVIVDRVQVSVVKNGKTKGGKIDAAHLAAMLKSEAFLSQFIAVDHISATPVYLRDFSQTEPDSMTAGQTITSSMSVASHPSRMVCKPSTPSSM